jgi:hypothetical protein
LNLNNVPRWRMPIVFPSTTHNHSDVTHISRSLHSPVSHPPQHLNITNRTFGTISATSDCPCRVPISAQCSSESCNLPPRCYIFYSALNNCRCHFGLHLLLDQFSCVPSRISK